MMNKNLMFAIIYSLLFVTLITLLIISVVVNLSPNKYDNTTNDNDTINVIIVDKENTIKQLKVEMTDEVNKAINDNDSNAVKLFMELVSK